MLCAKSQHPRQLPGTVARPRLSTALEHGTQGAVLLVQAPAGFGKTTLVSSWLEQRRSSERVHRLPSAWLSLDRGDSDLTVFLRYACATLDVVLPGICFNLLAMFNGPVTPALAEVATEFSNTVNDSPGDFILVLDDFHTIEGTDVPGLFSALARHWPAHLHLVLISRHAPNLPLTTLRAKGQLVELSADTLRFNLTEVREYLQRVTETEPAPQTIEQYATETGG